MNKQPELHTTNLLMQPLSISFENAALQILRFSKIHENTHAWVIPLHTHPTIELHYILRSTIRSFMWKRTIFM